MSEIHTINFVDKEIVDKLIEQGKIFATRDDVENGNAINVNKEYFDERNWEFDDEGRLIEVQEDGSKVVMGWVNKDDIKANTPKKVDTTPAPDPTKLHNSGHERVNEPAPKVEPGDPSTHYNGSYRDQSDIQKIKSSTPSIPTYTGPGTMNNEPLPFGTLDEFKDNNNLYDEVPGDPIDLSDLYENGKNPDNTNREKEIQDFFENAQNNPIPDATKN